jgi:hypothetical protein
VVKEPAASGFGSPTNFRERKPAQSAFRGSPKNVAGNIRTLDLCYPALGGAKGLHYGPHCVGRYDDRGLPFPLATPQLLSLGNSQSANSVRFSSV